HRHHSHLHSFPTRRSSDLSTPIRLTSITQRQLSSEIASMPPPAATPALLQITWTLPNASYVACAARSTLWGSATSQPTPRTFGLDRKSTRLNSSHLGISYA